MRWKNDLTIRGIVSADPSERARISHAIGRIGADILECSDCVVNGKDRAALATASMILLCAGRGYQAGSPRAVRQLRQKLATVPIILCASVQEVFEASRGAFARAGVDDFHLSLNPGHDSDLQALVLSRISHVLPSELLETPGSGGMSLGYVAEQWCARNSYRRVTADILAKHFHRNRRTLYRAACAVGWSGTRVMLRLARLLHVAAALENSSDRLADVAECLEFGSVSAFHKFVRRTTLQTTRSFKENGALATAKALWVDRQGRSLDTSAGR